MENVYFPLLGDQGLVSKCNVVCVSLMKCWAKPPRLEKTYVGEAEGGEATPLFFLVVSMLQSILPLSNCGACSPTALVWS